MMAYFLLLQAQMYFKSVKPFFVVASYSLLKLRNANRPRNLQGRSNQFL
jgi:hypothetical protein